MFKESGSLYNSEIFRYSDSDFSSFGSESESDHEQFDLDNIHLSSNQFFKSTTPEISQKVLNLDINKLDEEQKIDNTCSSNNHIEEQSEPKEIKKRIDIEQIGIKLHEFHQKFESNLSELKKSQSQLYELEKCNKDNENKNHLIEEIKKQPTNIYQQIEIANNQLNGVQKQLVNFFEEFNMNEMKVNDNDNKCSYSKMIGKVKEISGCINASLPLFNEEENHKKIESQESFESLCQHVEVIISEMDNIGKKLNELLDI